MNESYTSIESVIKRVDRKRKALFFLRSCLVGLAALLAAFGVAVLIIPALTGWWEIALRVLLLAAMATALIYVLLRPLLKRENMERVARVIEKANPGLNNALINSVQLVRAQGVEGSAGAFSRILLTKHLENTRASLDTLDLKSAASASHLKTPALFAAGIAVALGVILLVMPARTSQAFNSLFLSAWDAPDEKTPEETLPLTTGDFTLKYNFPQYSRIPSQTVNNSNGDIAALKGTQVIVKTRALEPLKSASLVTSAGERYEMKVSDNHRLEVELILSEPATYYIEGRGINGEKRSESGSRRIVVDEDLSPRISMTAPLSDVEVASEGSLPVSYEASDDFGVRKIELVYQRKGENEKILLKEIKEDGEKRLQGEYEWRLADMDFKPGERIPFYLLVTDNNLVASGRTGRSEMRVLEIYSARKNHRKILARQDELLNRMIDHLAAHITAAIKEGMEPAKLRDREQQLVKEGEQIVETMADIVSDMENDEFADGIMLDALAEMKKRYQGSLAERNSLLRQTDTYEEKNKERLIKLRSGYRADLENDIIYLDKMIKKARVEDMMAEADELYSAQAELADLLAEFKKTGDPRLLEELREKMADLESAFQGLMQRMAKMRKGMPEEFINADAMKSQNMKNLAEQMEKLKKALADGDMESAMKMADDFLSDMGKWMEAMESNANQFGQTISRKTMNKLSELETEINDAVKREKAIEDALHEMHSEKMKRREERQKRVEKTREGLQEVMEKLNKSLAGVRQEFYRLRPYDEHGRKPFDSKAKAQRRHIGSRMHGMRRDLQDLHDSLQKGNLDESLQKAGDLKEKLDKISRQAKSFSERINAGPEQRRKGMESNLEDAGRLLDRIISALEAVKEKNQCSAPAGGQSGMQGLSREQDELRKDVESMMQRYNELKQEAPSLPGKVPRHMDEAAFKMHEASGEMKLNAPGPAQGPARQARGELEQALKQMQQARQKMSKNMMPGGFMGKGAGMKSPGSRQGGKGTPDPEAEVDIPDEDKYKVPGRYREEILKAMKEESPEQYKNLNKDYYERLVK